MRGEREGGDGNLGRKVSDRAMTSREDDPPDNNADFSADADADFFTEDSSDDDADADGNCLLRKPESKISSSSILVLSLPACPCR